MRNFITSSTQRIILSRKSIDLKQKFYYFMYIENNIISKKYRIKAKFQNAKAWKREYTQKPNIETKDSNNSSIMSSMQAKKTKANTERIIIFFVCVCVETQRNALRKVWWNYLLCLQKCLLKIFCNMDLINPRLLPYFFILFKSWLAGVLKLLLSKALLTTLKISEPIDA